MRTSTLVATFGAFALGVSACGSVIDTGSGTTGTSIGVTGSTATSIGAGGIATDFGVTDEEIRIGYNSDLSGIFASRTDSTLQAVEVYWEWVNDSGGIAGRRVVPVILDSAYDIPQHLANHERFASEGPEGVVMIAQSLGSPHTEAIAQRLVEDDMAAIPLSWYSGWADPVIGANVFEVQSNYCLESMNGVTYLAEQFGPRVAIVSFSGEYGQDGAQGAKAAAAALGLEVVYDGEGVVLPGADVTPVADAIVASGADFVWTTVNPSALNGLVERAVAQGFTGMWSGNAPSYDQGLLDTDIAASLDRYYIHSTYTALWNSEVSPGMTEMVEQMRLRRPGLPVADTYLDGWINGMTVRQILERAAANGDLTRSGVTAAAREVTVDLKGLAPNQSWAGAPNDYIVRQSYLYDIDLTRYTPDLPLDDPAAGTGFQLLQGPLLSPTAAAYNYQGPCFAD